MYFSPQLGKEASAGSGEPRGEMTASAQGGSRKSHRVGDIGTLSGSLRISSLPSWAENISQFPRAVPLPSGPGSARTWVTPGHCAGCSLMRTEELRLHLTH